MLPIDLSTKQLHATVFVKPEVEAKEYNMNDQINIDASVARISGWIGNICIAEFAA